MKKQCELLEQLRTNSYVRLLQQDNVSLKSLY